MAAVPGHVLSRGAILLTVTSQGQQNALQKSRPVNIGQQKHCAWMGLECSYHLVQ